MTTILDRLKSLNDPARRIRAQGRLSGAWEALRNANPVGVLVIIAAVLLVAAQMVRTVQAEDLRRVSSAISWVGVLFFLVGIRAANHRALPPWMDKPVSRLGIFFSITRAQVIYLLAGLFLAVLAATSSGIAVYQPHPSIPVTLWLAAVFFIVLGAWRPAEAPALPARALVLGAGLAAGAFLLRAISLTDIPYVLTGDEASMGLSAVDFIKGNANNIFTIGWFSFPSLFYFLESLSIRVFGNTTVALRFPAALAGALTVAAVYFLGRTMFSRRAGLLAAIFLAGSHFHIHFSRLGLNNIWDGLWITLILGALWHGWKTNRRMPFILAGLCLGLAQYFYVSSRFLFGLIPAWVLVAAVLDRKTAKKHLGSLLLMGLLAAVVVAPLAWMYVQNPNEFMAPLTRVRLTPDWVARTAAAAGIPEWRVIANQIWTGLKAFTHQPILAWYQPGTPILRPVAAALFLLGLALLAMQPKNPRTWLIGLLFLVFGISSGLSFDPPAAQRYVAAAPWVALVLGFAVAETVEQLQTLWPQTRRLLGALAIILVLYVSLDDARFYFFEYTPRTQQYSGNDAVAQRLANHLQAHPDIEEVYFFGFPRMGYYSIRSIQFLVPDVVGVDMNDPWGSPANLPAKADAPVFVLLPEKAEDLSAVQEAFPGGTLIEEKTKEGVLVYWLYDTSGR